MNIPSQSKGIKSLSETNTQLFAILQELKEKNSTDLSNLSEQVNSTQKQLQTVIDQLQLIFSRLELIES
jgi:uncharacterized phage infection (PIP) family protein YhgE